MNITTSDPGSSGLLTPFVKMDGLYFEEGLESEDGIFDLEKEIAIYNQRLDEIQEYTFKWINEDTTVDQLLETKDKMAKINDNITFKVKED